MEKRSEIKSAIEELSMLVIVKPEGNHVMIAHIPTKPFLSLCHLVLQVLGGFTHFVYIWKHECDVTPNTLSLCLIDALLQIR